MSAWDGLQPDVLWGQDCGTSCDCVLLAAALVPWHPGAGTGGNSVHHHHLHPEVIGVDDQSGACCFSVYCLHMRDSFHANECLDWNLQWICACRGVAVERAALLCSDGGSAGF